MGWLHCAASREDLVNRLLDPALIPQHLILLDHSLRGNRLWVLYQSRSNPDYRFIVLHQLRGTGDPGGWRWGYRSVDEAMGPTAYDCPKRLLDASTCSADAAVIWRLDCAQARGHALRRRQYLASLRPGDAFTVGDRQVAYTGTAPGMPHAPPGRCGRP